MKKDVNIHGIDWIVTICRYKEKRRHLDGVGYYWGY